MTARMRRTAVGGSPVPWLASLAAVALVTALAWLATDEPSSGSIGTVDAGTGAASPTSEPDRPFSGLPALGAIIIETPQGGPFDRVPDGEGDSGPRTADGLVASTVAAGQSGDKLREELLVSGFRGGLARTWVHADGSVLFIAVDEFGTAAWAQEWAEGVASGIGGTDGAREVPTAIDGAVGYRFDTDSSQGVQHQAAYAFARGRRVAIVKLATLDTLDVALLEGHALAQAQRMEGAGP